jgi:hypothetical protein
MLWRRAVLYVVTNISTELTASVHIELSIIYPENGDDIFP